VERGHQHVEGQPDAQVALCDTEALPQERDRGAGAVAELGSPWAVIEGVIAASRQLASGNGGRHDRSIVAFSLMECPNVGSDLARLAGAVTAGRLDPRVPWRGSWKDAADATGALLGRRLNGKAVLDIDWPHHERVDRGATALPTIAGRAPRPRP
jgi:hypothetical protein